MHEKYKKWVVQEPKNGWSRNPGKDARTPGKGCTDHPQMDARTTHPWDIGTSAWDIGTSAMGHRGLDVKVVKLMVFGRKCGQIDGFGRQKYQITLFWTSKSPFSMGSGRSKSPFPWVWEVKTARLGGQNSPFGRSKQPVLRVKQARFTGK